MLVLGRAQGTVLRKTQDHRDEPPGRLHHLRKARLDFRPGQREPPRQLLPGKIQRATDDEPEELDRRQRIHREQHDPAHQEDHGRATRCWPRAWRSPCTARRDRGIPGPDTPGGAGQRGRRVPGQRGAPCGGDYHGGRSVKVTQAYRFALDLAPAGERDCRSHAGASRFAWNWGLAKCKERYEAEGKWYSAAELHKLWNAVKKTDPTLAWWGENSKTAYQEAFRDLERALGDFIKSRKGRRKGKRLGFPKAKKRGKCKDS